VAKLSPPLRRMWDNVCGAAAIELAAIGGTSDRSEMTRRRSERCGENRAPPGPAVFVLVASFFGARNRRRSTAVLTRREDVVWRSRGALVAVCGLLLHCGVDDRTLGIPVGNGGSVSGGSQGSKGTDAGVAAASLGSSAGTVAREDAGSNARPVDGTGYDAVEEVTPPEFKVSSVTPPFLAHGARVVINGTGFVDITSVNIGGQALIPQSMTATSIVIEPLPENVATGAVPLIVQKRSESQTLTVNVGRLVLNEIDPVPDVREYIEVLASPTPALAGVDVSGYVIVAFDYRTNASVNAVELTARVNTDGLMLLRAPGTVVAETLGAASIVDYPAAFLPNSQGAVAIYEGSLADFPLNTTVTSARLIDAVVYEADDDTTFEAPCMLFRTLYGGTDTCVMDEDTGDDQNVQAVARCTATLRKRSLSWRITATVTPGAPNDCVNIEAFNCSNPVCP
jgi:hypothetical protein